MKPKNILIALALLIVAAAYIYFFEIPAGEKAQQAKKPFAGLQQNDISSLEIKSIKNSGEILKFSNSKSGEKSEVQKTSASTDNWKYEAAEYGAVDQATFSALVSQLLASDLGSSLPKNEIDSDLSLYGLSQPELELSVGLASTKKLKFAFGKRSEFVGKRYLALSRDAADTDIYMTDDLLFFAANKAALDFRRKDPLQIEDSKQQKLLIKSGQFPSELILEKSKSKIAGDSGDSWFVKVPYQSSADDQKVTDMLRALKNLKVKSILENQAATDFKSLIDSPMILIGLFDNKDQQSAPQEIRITKKARIEREAIVYWSKYPKTLFIVEDDKLFSQFEDLDAYRKHSFFKPAVSDVQSISIEDANFGLLVKANKKDLTWTLSGNSQLDGKPADPVFIEEYIQQLSEISAIEFPEAGESDFGFEKPLMKISISLDGDQPDSKIDRSFVLGKQVVFDNNQKGYFAAVDDLSEPFIVDASVLDKIKPKPGTWVIIPTAIPAVEATVP